MHISDRLSVSTLCNGRENDIVIAFINIKKQDHRVSLSLSELYRTSLRVILALLNGFNNANNRTSFNPIEPSFEGS